MMYSYIIFFFFEIDMKQIPEEIREYINYNPDTGVFTWRKDHSTRMKKGKIVGNVQWDGYYRVGFKGIPYYGHRVAWFLTYGVQPEHEIDHINGDRSDNRLDNLRAAKRKQNTYNTPVRKDSRTQVKGVHFRRDTGKYRAHCRVDGIVHWLGNFDKIEEAAEAVRKFREENHKEFHNHG